MKSYLIQEGNIHINGSFDKVFKNDNYEVYFNTKKGTEILKGTNNIDPFNTQLPLLIDVGIMGSCINSCNICYQGKQKEPHMTFENFKLIIDQVKHHTNQVALGGRGDPNLHPQFKKIVEYARCNNVVPNYTTSGNGLTDEQIEISKICGAVAVSDYEKDYTYDSILRLIEAGIKTNIHMIFSRYSYDKIMKILYGYNPWYQSLDRRKRIHLFDINKINAIIFLLFKPQGSGLTCVDWIPDKFKLETFSKKIFNNGCKIKVGMDSCLMNKVSPHIKLPKIQQIAINTCEGARMSVYISPSMKMSPCSFADHDKIGIKITKKDDIDYIWNRSKIFNKFRSVLKKDPLKCPIGF